jgi:hypothetical protein|tara:strand:- start:6451 stop:6654 length:204 start_codon:yes stop_codon:yes gene_type:complete
MKVSELLEKFIVFTSNEEQALYEKLPAHATPYNSYSEREQVVLENLIRKSLVSKISTKNMVMVAKNE